MLQLIYTSVATKPLSNTELNKLLNQSRLRNEFANVTGMLLFDRGTFLQVIEGPEYTIQKLYERIKADTRHQRMIVLSERRIKHREFSKWKMGYAHLAPRALRDL
ncbi:MAG TPA: blue light sensor protein, partial [Phycisphaerales bacterium]|nr:blue light sensor protein [Phycisphaerales bacterium]